MPEYTQMKMDRKRAQPVLVVKDRKNVTHLLKNQDIALKRVRNSLISQSDQLKERLK